MERREFMKTIGATTVGALPWLNASPLDLTGRHPNIVLILTDDQGYGDMSCHGNPILKTPHLDRLHSESARFTDYHVSPTCSPTRCSLMTGRHEFKSGVTHTIMERERMSRKAVTLPQILKSAGYTTGIFGKWHLGDEPERWPDKRGFDEMFIHGAGGIGQTYPGSCGDAPGNTYFSPVLLHNGRFIKSEGYCTDVFFRQALDWIGSRRKLEAPFFAYITPNVPHAPLQCPPEYRKLYADRVQPRGKVDVAAYFGMIANLDDNVGQLLSRLKEWDLERNTLVLFMTDNGGTTAVHVFNDGLRGAKGTPYQGGTRAVSFWRWPGSLNAANCSRLAAHIDVLPTLAAIAGAKIPATAKPDGRSLLPLLINPNDAWADRYLFTHVGRWAKGQAAQSKYEKCAVRTLRWRLVNNNELYDIANDRGENHNMLEQHPDVAADLRKAYDRWWEEILPCLENEETIGPKVNPFKELYWKQYGGPGPNNVGPDDPAAKPLP